MQLWIALFWAIMIAVLHAIPGQDLAFIQMDDLSHLDKIFHLGVFAIGAWLFMRALKQQYAVHAFRYTFTLYALYALLLELMQGACFESREADFIDWVADIVGVLLALLLHQKIYSNEPIKS